MNVFVAAPEFPCPASNALNMEGIEHVSVPTFGPYGYADLFAGLWDSGKPFVLVEHDIVPWPGAITELEFCSGRWCTFDYPMHQGHLTRGMGIGKYFPKGPAPEHWYATEWDQLDGQVIPVLNKVYDASRPCIHTPAVAHARKELAP